MYRVQGLGSKYPIIGFPLEGSIGVCRDTWGLGQGFRVQVPNHWVFGCRETVFIIQVWGKYVFIRYLDP